MSASLKVPLKAPFPYFGGKRTVTELVWTRLGDVDNLIEPFCGSAAMLLSRPTAPRIETLNDADCYVANFWRATQGDPGSVAEHADWPVNEADLHARHRWLVLSDEAAAFRARMRTDPDYFDSRIAGWWCWGLCCWIGGGWCSGVVDAGERRPCTSRAGANGGVHSIEDEDLGLHQKRPGLGDGKPPNLSIQQNKYGRREHVGRGVHKKALKQCLPSIAGDSGASGRGVVASAGPATAGRPQLADAHARGRGVHANDKAGSCDERRAWLLDWFGRLRDRLRAVRVCSGHWLRVCDSPSVTTRLGLTGVFLDPPYAHSTERLAKWIEHLKGEGLEPEPAKGATNRDSGLYSNDKRQDVDRLVAEVHLYCLDRGTDAKMRLALCGYEGEQDGLEAAGWTVVAWKAQGGYGNRSQNGRENSARERIWFSPHCLDPQASAGPLFDF
jgi:hypothetical protein